MSEDHNTQYAFEMLAGAIARGADGIAAAPDGTDPEIADRILRGLQVLRDHGLADLVEIGGRVFGAQLTQAGMDLGARLEKVSEPPVRRPGDVLDVAIVSRR